MAMDEIDRKLRRMEQAIRKNPDRFVPRDPTPPPPAQIFASPQPTWVMSGGPNYTTAPAAGSHTHSINVNTTAPYVYTTNTTKNRPLY